MFWAGVGLVLLLAAVLIVMLYASAIVLSTDEPYFRALKDLIKQIISGRFW